MTRTFFLGNLRHPANFTIVGLWWPKKKGAKVQQELF